MALRKFLNTNFKVTSKSPKECSLLNVNENEIILFSDSNGKISEGIIGPNNQRFRVGFSSITSVEDKAEIWSEYPIWVLTDSNDKILGWLKLELLYQYFYNKTKAEKQAYEAILHAIPYNVTVINENANVIFMNETAIETLGSKKEQAIGKPLAEVDKESALAELLGFTDKQVVLKVSEDKKGLITLTNMIEAGVPLGAVQVSLDVEEIKSTLMKLELYSNLEQDLKAVFDTSYDVIYVSDEKGTTLRVSSAAEHLWGFPPEKLVGKSVFELERMGVYKPSVTKLVLEKKEKVTAIQTTKTGRRLVVVGTPILDDNGNITRVINTSRDVTMESYLQTELEETRTILEGYKQELQQLRELKMQENTLIFKSEKMRNVVFLANKVAEVDSTVLIYGESGVGKEVIASFIHSHSKRKENPFIKVNCSAIPESLLESEFFGYDKGAFTGASKEGKIGLFEAANEGTLFLDEIGDIPFSLQAKLLRVIQEKEVVRLGSTTPIPVNVRIITATNRNLEEEVRKGSFREDLYYRLNVVPIRIPSLRERREDILPLAFHFIEKFNKEYNRGKSISLEVTEILQAYDWPGNVRELQNLLERLVVITETETIETRHLPDNLLQSQQLQANINISNIMPLQLAVDNLEKQLLTMAKEKYETTSRMAEALGVNQSTISRKMRKHGIS